MKTLLLLFILMSGFSAFGQNPQPKPLLRPTPRPVIDTKTPTEQVEPQVKEKPSFDLSKDDVQVLGELKILELTMQTCGFKPTDKECYGLETKLAETYQKIARSPQLLNIIFADAVSNYEKLRPQTRSAPQVSQIADEQNVILNRIIVAQNQRIIELLERLVNKK